MPSIVIKLLQVINSPDSSADDAAHLIKRDPALTSKMLRLANSAFYGTPRAVSSVSSAVVILGFNAIKSLVLSASLVKMFPAVKGESFDRNRFWMHSIVCAIASRAITRHILGIKLMDPESAFCSGILHDIGKLIFGLFATQQYADVCNWAAQQKVPLREAETQRMGINHAEIGRIVADKWALPLDLEYAIVFHHTPQSADKLQDLVAVVHLADCMAHEMHSTSVADEPAPPRWSGAFNILQIDDSEYECLKRSVFAEIDKSKEFFSVISA